ncbi:YhdP family phospholipid transporter, partial [Methylothermus subterraneus]
MRLSLWLSLIGLALVLLALRFWLLPRSDQFRHPLEKSLSLYLHQPVRIGHLQAGLDGIAPKLRLIAVAVGPPEEARLQFEEVEIKLDLPASLRTGRLQPAQVKILGARIEIAQDANGRFHVLGLPAGGKELIPAWLLQDGRFELLGGTLVWHVGSRPRLWRNLDLRLANRGPEHRLWARFAAPEALAEQASVSAKIQGDPNTPNWEAEFQIHLKQWQLTGLKAFLPGEFRRNLQGQGTLTLQGTWRPARWQATAEVDLHRLTWRPSWLAQPLELHHLRGQIRGHWDNNGWQVHAQPLHLNNADFEAYAQLRLARPAQEAPYLALSADFRRLKLANLDAYLPSRATPGLVRWLARKPLHGTVSGHLVWRGRWPGFPLRDLSEARLSGPRVRIEFHPSWPALAATDLSLTSRDGRITLAAHRGQLADVPIESLSASLDSTASDPVLTIQGHSRTSVANLLKVLERSPLAPAVAKLTAKTRLAGRAAVLLDISLPVQRPKEYQIDGRVELQQAAWQLTEQALGLNALSGELRFSRHRLTARLHGKLGQQPAHLEADVDRDRTRLTLLTQLTPEVLPSAALRPLVKGTTSAELALELSHTPNTPARLRLRSQLQGLAVHLPYPLGKRA